MLLYVWSTRSPMHLWIYVKLSHLIQCAKHNSTLLSSNSSSLALASGPGCCGSIRDKSDEEKKELIIGEHAH